MLLVFGWLFVAAAAVLAYLNLLVVIPAGYGPPGHSRIYFAAWLLLLIGIMFLIRSTTGAVESILMLLLGALLGSRMTSILRPWLSKIPAGKARRS